MPSRKTGHGRKLTAHCDRGNPIAANRVLAAVRKMFGWAVERDILTASPVVNVKAPGREIERERVLTDDELIAVWTAADTMGSASGSFLKTLILTGQRRDEVSSMRWADLDLTVRIWTLPRQATKGDRSHEVPLSPLAIEVLTALPRTGTYVFSSTRGERPISGYSKIKARAEKLAGFDDWRIHDLRRTAGTGMARAGTAVSTISRVLNHKEGGVTKIYNRYSYLDEKRHALETWARKVGSLVRPGADNVVPLRAESA
jgi:integrase